MFAFYSQLNNFNTTTRKLVMKTTKTIAAAMLLGTLACGTAMAQEPTPKVALVPGGPHPYFAAWEQAGKNVMKDFNLGAGNYRVPARWELVEARCSKA